MTGATQMPVFNGLMRAGALVVTTALGAGLADAYPPISNTSPITLGLLLGGLASAFWVGMTLKGIQTEIRSGAKRMDEIDTRVKDLELKGYNRHDIRP